VLCVDADMSIFYLDGWKGRDGMYQYVMFSLTDRVGMRPLAALGDESGRWAVFRCSRCTDFLISTP
jgi:hypothetical protein